MVFVLLLHSAFAHTQILYVLLELSFLFLALGLALIAKLRPVSLFLRHKQSPPLQAYVGFFALEFFIRRLSLVFAKSMSPRSLLRN
jgi:hypothetical protein